MPGFSKDTAPNVGEFGPVTDRHDDIDGYTVTIVSFAADVDGAPLLKGLEDDLCQCPHWGYQFAGTQTVVYADHEEVIEAGDAFYMVPGHTARASDGAEFVVFSPTAELRITEDAMARNMQALQGA